MPVTQKQDYHFSLAQFVELLTTHQKKAVLAKSIGANTTHVFAFVESGRKFDKVLLRNGATSTVRYFIDRKTGNIYGAKSRLAPNLKWYFGDIYRADRWEWGDFHGRPVNDPDIRAIKAYGGYTHYMKV